MRTAAILLLLTIFCIGAASAQTDAELKAVKGMNLRFQVLLYQIYEYSNWNPPPGTNAASGLWRDRLLKDERFINVGKFSQAGLTGDAAKLGAVFKVYYDGIAGAFTSNENVEATWLLPGDGSLLRSSLGKSGEQVYGLSFSILESGGGDEVENKKFATEARNSARALIKTIDHKGPLGSGTNANPQIAVSAYNAAQAALAELDKQFAGDFSGPGGPGATVMRQVFTEMIGMPTVLADLPIPWLWPGWQLQYQYICLTGSIVLEKVSPPDKQ